MPMSDNQLREIPLPEPEGRDIRQVLAQRRAQRGQLRAERAERLARLHPADNAPETVETAVQPTRSPEARVPVLSLIETSAKEREAPGASAPASEQDAVAALEDFLRALTGGAAAPMQKAAPAPRDPASETPPIAEATPPRVVWSQSEADIAEAPEEEASDLDLLIGARPGLIWALRRAGVTCLGDLAPLSGAELTARLGPLGRLVPVDAWIATAREACR